MERKKQVRTIKRAAAVEEVLNCMCGAVELESEREGDWRHLLFTKCDKPKKSELVLSSDSMFDVESGATMTKNSNFKQ